MTKAPEQSLDLVQLFRSARKVSTPLIAVRSADQPACMRTLAMSLTNADDNTELPLLQWDSVRGLQGLNATSQQIAASFGDAMVTANPAEMTGMIATLPPLAVVFMHNAQRQLDNNVTVQGIANLRDIYKNDRRTLVMLCPDVTLPAELQTDVLVLDDALPTDAQLRELIIEQCKQAPGMKQPSDEQIDQAVAAVAGLAMFPSEQVIAMSLRKSGIDIGRVWERKRQAIEQVPGLSVWRGGESFDDIGGCENAKRFGYGLRDGKRKPRTVVFIDEIEKAMAGNAGDTSGVSQDMLGTLLTWMQDNRATGMILVGPPGAAKSAYAKALGNTLDVPTIQFDLSGMKGSLVGESGRNIRQALKVVKATAQEQPLFIATCNAIGTLPPELRRRFKYGTFFFDLPTAEERAAIWQLYLDKHKLNAKSKRPMDEGWTGAEISTCCELANDLGMSLVDAAEFIVPVARSAAEQITRLREQAHGRFISASYRGTYKYERTPQASAPTTAGRTVDLDD